MPVFGYQVVKARNRGYAGGDATARCWSRRQSPRPAGLFHRPLGGRVEYGEYALETVGREFREEIGRSFGRANPSPSVATYRDRR
jgi:ADP-ribose pyrophosphatase YjhB (NUDIX family)